MKFNSETMRQIAKDCVKSKQEVCRKINFSRFQQKLFNEIKKAIVDAANHGEFDCEVSFDSGSAMYNGGRHNPGYNLTGRQIESLDKVLYKLSGYGFCTDIISTGSVYSCPMQPRISISWKKDEV